MSSSLLYFSLFSTANNAICQRFISQCLLVPRQHVRQLRSSQPAVQNACTAVSLMALPCACAFRYMSYCGAHGALQAAATSGGGQVVFCSLIEHCFLAAQHNKVVYCPVHGNLGPYFIADQSGLVTQGHVAPDSVRAIVAAARVQIGLNAHNCTVVHLSIVTRRNTVKGPYCYI